MSETISGLGTLGFWLFLAIVVAVITWASVRKAKIRQEALAKLVESGQNLDKELIESIFPSKKEGKNPFEQKPKDPDRMILEGVGFTFLLGFFTVFAGFAWKGGISYPIAGLGAFAILWSIFSGFRLEKQVKEREKQKLEGLE